MATRFQNRPISLGQEPEFERYVSTIAGNFSERRDSIPADNPSPVSGGGIGSLIMVTICLLGLMGTP